MLCLCKVCKMLLCASKTGTLCRQSLTSCWTRRIMWRRLRCEPRPSFTHLAGCLQRHKKRPKQSGTRLDAHGLGAKVWSGVGVWEGNKHECSRQCRVPARKQGRSVPMTFEQHSINTKHNSPNEQATEARENSRLGKRLVTNRRAT